MEGTRTQFEAFLAQEIQNSRGTAFPVKTELGRRLLVREAECLSLHPNPEDEFCSPKIGPNYEIISRYQQEYIYNIKMGLPYYDGEPIIVERLYPSGYRIINGHHRWAAALRIGQEKIPVRIVNLTHEEDVRKILENSTHVKRAAFDLDEVLFQTDPDAPRETAKIHSIYRLNDESLRLGAPALIHFLKKSGYDIWVYSVNYYSTDSVQRYFHKHHVNVDGVMTAAGRKLENTEAAGRRIADMLTNKYRYTVHIDKDTVTQIFSKTRTFEEFPLSGDPSTWSQEVMDVTEQLDRKAEKDRAEP